MTLDDAVRSTLRVLISPPRLLRTNIAVLQRHDERMTNLALELCASRAGGLSVVELCPDGELIAGRDVACPDAVDGLSLEALTHAMHTLWGREPADAESLAGLASIRANCMLMKAGTVGGFDVLLSWYCRVDEGIGHVSVWRGDRQTVARILPMPTATSVRALISELHARACEWDAEAG